MHRPAPRGLAVTATASVHGRPASAPALGVPRSRSLIWLGILVTYLAGTLGLAHSSSYEQGLLLVAAVYSILALSLDLVAGTTGLYSLGHAGLFAIGAYATTILTTHYGWNIFVALPVIVLAVGLVGVVIGALALRVSGLYFAITTLIFTIIVNVLVSDLTITGGYQGLPSPSFPDFPPALSGLGTALVWAVSAALLVTVTIIWSIRASALYPALLAIRDSEPFASSVGVRTALTRVAVFSLSAALAGLAGWTFSFLGFITPGQFDSTAAINILVMVILGGINTRTRPDIRCRLHQPLPDRRQHQPVVAGDTLRLRLPPCYRAFFPKASSACWRGQDELCEDDSPANNRRANPVVGRGVEPERVNR